MGTVPANYVEWKSGVKYKIPTVVLYKKNGKFYNLKQVDKTGTSNGTDPTVSTWYWEPWVAPASAPAPAPAPVPAPTPVVEQPAPVAAPVAAPAPVPAPTTDTQYPSWISGHLYTIPTIVVYPPNGKLYRLKQVDASGTSSGTDPTVSTWYWEYYGEAPAAPPAPQYVSTKQPTFVDNFSTLDLSKWTVSTWTAPGNNTTHNGKFLASNVVIKDGMLCLKLQQVKNPDGTFTSTGGEIASKMSFGFGTYEMEVRASSTASSPYAPGNPISGSITGCFNYGPLSVTEIDYEVEGNSRHNQFQFTSWKGETNPNESTKVYPAADKILPHEVFFNVKFVWTPTDITFYRNDVMVAKHTKVIPTTACPMMFNHWGTNFDNWGGFATPGIERYMWVKKFAFTPL